VRLLAHDWGMGVLVIEHNVDMLFSVCDVVTVLAEGRVLANGSAAEIQGNAGVLTAYLGGDTDQLDVSKLASGPAAA
jgi:ABC-type branched-subunit amino acid transport system ATPase component